MKSIEGPKLPRQPEYLDDEVEIEQKLRDRECRSIVDERASDLSQLPSTMVDWGAIVGKKALPLTIAQKILKAKSSSELSKLVSEFKIVIGKRMYFKIASNYEYQDFLDRKIAEKITGNQPLTLDDMLKVQDYIARQLKEVQGTMDKVETTTINMQNNIIIQDTRDKFSDVDSSSRENIKLAVLKAMHLIANLQEIPELSAEVIEDQPDVLEEDEQPENLDDYSIMKEDTDDE